jgi:hypothetical protein
LSSSISSDGPVVEVRFDRVRRRASPPRKGAHFSAENEKTRRGQRRVERGKRMGAERAPLTSAKYASYGDSTSSASGACACSFSDDVSFSDCP